MKYKRDFRVWLFSHGEPVLPFLTLMKAELVLSSFTAKRGSPNKLQENFLLGFIFIFFLLLIGCQSFKSSNSVPKTTIVCLGASITEGFGAQVGHDYPSYLRKMVNVPVMNAGINGDTTRGELRRIGRDVLSQHPAIVIITQRSNDIKFHIPRAETLRNMEAIIHQIKGSGGIPVLVTFENREFRNLYGDSFSELSRKYHILLIQDVFKDFSSNPKYMYDDVHPNSEGYKVIAKRIFEQIKPLLK